MFTPAWPTCVQGATYGVLTLAQLTAMKTLTFADVSTRSRAGHVPPAAPHRAFQIFVGTPARAIFYATLPVSIAPQQQRRAKEHRPDGDFGAGNHPEQRGLLLCGEAPHRFGSSFSQLLRAGRAKAMI